MNQLKVELIQICEVSQVLAEMVALFRVELRSYKGIVSKVNIDAGREEMEEYLCVKFPVYAALIVALITCLTGILVVQMDLPQYF